MGKKEILYLAISSLILTIIWIASNVYHAYATSTIDSVLTTQITPISADFDMRTIQKIRDRIQVEPANNVVLPPSPTPTISVDTVVPSETTTPTPEEVTPAPDASAGGQLESQP